MNIHKDTPCCYCKQLCIFIIPNLYKVNLHYLIIEVKAWKILPHEDYLTEFSTPRIAAVASATWGKSPLLQ